MYMNLLLNFIWFKFIIEILKKLLLRNKEKSKQKMLKKKLNLKFYLGDIKFLFKSNIYLAP